jgi:chitin-binding protein
MTVTFPSGVAVSGINLWNGVFSTSGQVVTVTNEPYNGSISPGGTVVVGYTVNGPDTAPSITTACS